MESVKEIEDQAAAWLVRRDAGSWTEADQTQLDRWLESSTGNVVAFVRLETAWQRTHRLKSLRARNPASVVPAFAARLPARTVRDPAPWRRPFAIAASVLLVATAWAVFHFWPGSPPSYRTPVGGIASVPMIDGSKITLNTDSEIRVAVTDVERRVELERGEAFFDVARDPRRPFVVSAGDKRVVAVGTKFSVRRDKDDIDIVVTEGKVRIEKNGHDEVLIPAGSVAHSRRNQVMLQQKPVPEVEASLSWRSGFLTFREATLAEAIAEFNRYNTRKIVIDDEAIASIRMSGRFQSTQYAAFIRLLEDSFQIHAESTDDRIVLSLK